MHHICQKQIDKADILRNIEGNVFVRDFLQNPDSILNKHFSLWKQVCNCKSCSYVLAPAHNLASPHILCIILKIPQTVSLGAKALQILPKRIHHAVLQAAQCTTSPWTSNKQTHTSPAASASHRTPTGIAPSQSKVGHDESGAVNMAGSGRPCRLMLICNHTAACSCILQSHTQAQPLISGQRCSLTICHCMTNLLACLVGKLVGMQLLRNLMCASQAGMQLQGLLQCSNRTA